MKLTFEYSRKVNRMWEPGYGVYINGRYEDAFLVNDTKEWILASDDLVYFNAEQLEQILIKLKELNANDK